MGSSKSKQNGQKVKATTHAKTTIKRSPINIPMTQNVLLIWLDPNIDEDYGGCQHTITQFRDAVNNIDMFTDGDECIQFLHATPNEKACIIISGSLGQQIVPRVHNLTQVDSIFVFCSNKKYHEEWTKYWPKIKGIFTETEPLCEAIKHAAQQCDQHAMSITIIGTEDNPVHKADCQLDHSFMYTQIIKEIFLTIDFNQQHFDQFIQYCRQALVDNGKQLEYVEEMSQQYDQHRAIWWYTRDTFLYAMLNRALRVMDIDVMMKMGFFIAHLHHHIKQLHQQQFSNVDTNQMLTVYRGQGMGKDAFQKMTSNTGGLISFNGFLSTSKKHSTSLGFAENVLTNGQLIGVLFVINIEPKASSTPFASVHDVGYYGGAEEEVLFSMHTVFRIGKATPIGGTNQLVEVQLNLASEKDNDLCDLINYIREETFPDSSGWFRLGLILMKMGETTKAQQVLETLLTEKLEKEDKAPNEQQLETIESKQEEHADVMQYHEKPIEIRDNHIAGNDLDKVGTYNAIGMVYSDMGDYIKALLFYEKALEIRQQSLPPTDPDLAGSYNNIANVYSHMGDYSEALLSNEKALEIRQRSLPATHPDLANTYNNIGLVYSGMGDYPKALLCHEKALEIRQQSLPPTHPDLAGSYNNIGLTYSDMGNYHKALVFHEKALKIKQQSLPATHPDLALSYNNIGLAFSNIDDYPKSFLFHEKALKIRQQSLPPTHPDLASSYNNIGSVYYKMGDYLNAFVFHEKALEIRQQSLPPFHPDLASSYNNIGSVYYKMGDYPKALLSHENALQIMQQSLSPTHPDLAASYNNIGLVYSDMGDYDRALLSHKTALKIRQQSLPPTNPDLAAAYFNIGLIYSKMDEFSKAIWSYVEALIIRKRAFGLDHPDCATIFRNLGLQHEFTGKLWKALSYYEYAVDLAQRSLPADDPFLLQLKYDFTHTRQNL